MISLTCGYNGRSPIGKIVTALLYVVFSKNITLSTVIILTSEVCANSDRVLKKYPGSEPTTILLTSAERDTARVDLSRVCTQRYARSVQRH